MSVLPDGSQPEGLAGYSSLPSPAAFLQPPPLYFPKQAAVLNAGFLSACRQRCAAAHAAEYASFSLYAAIMKPLMAAAAAAAIQLEYCVLPAQRCSFANTAVTC